MAKQYIYVCRCLKKRLSLTEFIFKVEQKEQFEKAYAERQNNLHKHFKKWYGVVTNKEDKAILNQNNYIMQYVNEIQEINIV